MKLNRNIILLVVLACAACGTSVPRGSRTSLSTLYDVSRWARPDTMPGVPNLFRVSETLSRSGQPTARGMRRLEEAGIRTIINLRSLHSDIDEIGDGCIRYVHIPTSAWRVDEEDVIAFLSVVTDEKNAPVLVHCNYGADRTGFMCAVYRVCVCGWSKDEAIDEMVSGGFGFHRMWGRLVDYLDALDVHSVRTKAGLTRSSPVSDNSPERFAE